MWTWFLFYSIEEIAFTDSTYKMALNLLFGAAFNLPISYIDEIPDEYKDSFASGLSIAFESIIGSDQEVLKHVVSKYKEYASVEELLDAVKEKSPELHGRLREMEEFLTSRIAKLDFASGQWLRMISRTVEQIHKELHTGGEVTELIVKEYLAGYINAFKQMDPAAQSTFYTQFPILTETFNSEKFQGMIEQLLADHS